MRISDWSPDVCSSDLTRTRGRGSVAGGAAGDGGRGRARTAVAGPPVRPSGTLAELQNGVDHLLSALDAGAEILVDRLGGGNEGILVGLVHRDAARLQLVQQVGLHLGGRLVDEALGLLATAVEYRAHVLRQGGVVLLRHQGIGRGVDVRSEEHTSELQSLMRISYAVFCLKKKNKTIN